MNSVLFQFSVMMLFLWFARKEGSVVIQLRNDRIHKKIDWVIGGNQTRNFDVHGHDVAQIALFRIAICQCKIIPLSYKNTIYARSSNTPSVTIQEDNQ